MTANSRCKGRSLPNSVGVRKLVSTSGIKISAVCSFISSQSTRVAYGRTDRQNCEDRASIHCSCGARKKIDREFHSYEMIINALSFFMNHSVVVV